MHTSRLGLVAATLLATALAACSPDHADTSDGLAPTVSRGVTTTQALPWPLPGSPPLPPLLTVPYLPAVAPVCPGGELSCFYDLESQLVARRSRLGCDHDAIFVDSYLTITRALIVATTTPGYFERPDRLNHEARQYAQEAFDQFDRWHSGDRATVSPSWQIAFQASADESVTALGDILLQLNAHIRRDNPIRAIEQAEGVLRIEGTMPAASGRPDHDRVSDVLQDALEPMLDHLAHNYDPTIDDQADLFGTIIDQKGLYLLISSWREESWRNAEQLRLARAAGGVNGLLYRTKLAEIEAAAEAGAELIKAATLTTPAANASRNAYCDAHVHDP